MPQCSQRGHRLNEDQGSSSFSPSALYPSDVLPLSGVLRRPALSSSTAGPELREGSPPLQLRYLCRVLFLNAWLLLWIRWLFLWSLQSLLLSLQMWLMDQRWLQWQLMQRR